MGDERVLSPKPRQERPQVNPGLGLPARPVGDGIRGELPRGSGRPRMRSVRPATQGSRRRFATPTMTEAVGSPMRAGICTSASGVRVTIILRVGAQVSQWGGGIC